MIVTTDASANALMWPDAALWPEATLWADSTLWSEAVLWPDEAVDVGVASEGTELVDP